MRESQTTWGAAGDAPGSSTKRAWDLPRLRGCTSMQACTPEGSLNRYAEPAWSPARCVGAWWSSAQQLTVAFPRTVQEISSKLAVFETQRSLVNPNLKLDMVKFDHSRWLCAILAAAGGRCSRSCCCGRGAGGCMAGRGQGSPSTTAGQLPHSCLIANRHRCRNFFVVDEQLVIKSSHPCKKCSWLSVSGVKKKRGRIKRSFTCWRNSHNPDGSIFHYKSKVSNKFVFPFAMHQLLSIHP